MSIEGSILREDETRSFERDADNMERSIETLEQSISSLKYDLDLVNKRLQMHLALFRSLGVRIPDGESVGREAMPRRVEISSREALEAFDGFYYLEYAQQHAYRWTGPGNYARFRLWIDRSSPVVMQASVMSFGRLENKDALSITVDGQELGIHTSDDQIWSDPFICHSENVSTEVILHVPFMFTPSEEKGGEDNRLLGIALYRVIFTASGVTTPVTSRGY